MSEKFTYTEQSNLDIFRPTLSVEEADGKLGSAHSMHWKDGFRYSRLKALKNYIKAEHQDEVWLGLKGEWVKV